MKIMKELKKKITIKRYSVSITENISLMKLFVKLKDGRYVHKGYRYRTDKVHSESNDTFRRICAETIVRTLTKLNLLNDVDYQDTNIPPGLESGCIESEEYIIKGA